MALGRRVSADMRPAAEDRLLNSRRMIVPGRLYRMKVVTGQRAGQDRDFYVEEFVKFDGSESMPLKMSGWEPAYGQHRDYLLTNCYQIRVAAFGGMG